MTKPDLELASTLTLTRQEVFLEALTALHIKRERYLNYYAQTQDQADLFIAARCKAAIDSIYTMP